MPRLRRLRRRTIIRRPMRPRRANNALFMENFPLPVTMSSTNNYFALAYNKITPTLAGSPRAVNLVRVSLQVPPVPVAGIFQLLFVDPVDDQLFPVTRGVQLSTVNPTNVTATAPRRFMRYFPTNSTKSAFVMAFRFTSNQTFTSNVMAKMFFQLVPDTINTVEGMTGLASEFEAL